MINGGKNMNSSEHEISTKKVIKHSKETEKTNAPDPKEILKQIKKQKQESGD